MSYRRNIWETQAVINACLPSLTSSFCWVKELLKFREEILNHVEVLKK